MIELRNIDLNLLPLFAAVAESSSFTAAALRLGVTKAKVSLGVARLESALGLTLFTRTTRRVALTAAGRELQAQCVPLLRGMGEALGGTRGAEPAVAGTLRISCSVEHAVHTIAPVASRFAALHPQLELDLRCSDRVVDLVKDGIDLAFRLGWLRDSTLRAVRLGSFEQILIAAPEYLRRAGTPKTPQDLVRHDWVALDLLAAPLTWRFMSPREGSTTVRMRARMHTDSPSTLRALVEAGAGISVLDAETCRAALRCGGLKRLLPQWELPTGGIHAVFPPGRHLGTNAKAFLDFFRAS